MIRMLSDIYAKLVYPIIWFLTLTA